MIAVVACSGIAVGAGLGLLLRRDRSFQLLALGLLSLALAAAFLFDQAPLPALATLLMGALAEVVLLAPAARPRPVTDDLARPNEPKEWIWIAIPAIAALAAVGVLIGAGVASRTAFSALLSTPPTLAEVGHQLVMGTGIAVLVIGLLAATTVVGGTALLQRDPRELVEEQLEQARRRRLEAQRRRRTQREEARAAARAARRGGNR